MEYVLMVKLKSKYGETDPLDIQEMQNKIRHWMSLIQKENNNSNRHLGLHLSILDYQVFPNKM